MWLIKRGFRCHVSARSDEIDARDDDGGSMRMVGTFSPGIEGRIAIVADVGWNAVDAEAPIESGDFPYGDVVSS